MTTSESELTRKLNLIYEIGDYLHYEWGDTEDVDELLEECKNLLRKEYESNDK